MQVGEGEWSKLSDKEKQRRIIELKMKEKKLRQEGKTDEVIDLYDKLVESDEFGENQFLPLLAISSCLLFFPYF